MIEVKGNLWDIPADWRGITTNGTINKAGEIVMGKGCALEAKRRYPGLPRAIASYVSTWGIGGKMPILS